MPEFQNTHALPPAGLFRRLGAIVSDLLVVVGLLLLSTLVLFLPVLHLLLGKKAMVPSEVGWAWYSIYLLTMLTIWFGFCGYFWTRSGQTIGMRAWRIRVETEQATLVTWQQALQRWLCANISWLPSLLLLMAAERFGSITLKYMGQGLSLLGVVAWLVMYLDPQRRTWHDRVSKTRVTKLPKL
jgi:uncharacterized RDD family membrane protein YckC